MKEEGSIHNAGSGIAVELRGMKKIVRVNQRNRVAMVEPGVVFGKLMAAVTEGGLRLNMPLQERPNR